jgi:hypothetical protein
MSVGLLYSFKDILVVSDVQYNTRKALVVSMIHNRIKGFFVVGMVSA